MNKFVKIGFVAVFAVVAGYGVYTSQKTDVMSDLALANVEALAQNESGKGCTADKNAICETSHNDYSEYRNN